MIMKYVEDESRKRGFKKAIIHARDYALEFYTKIGYVVIEKSYLLYDVLQHFYCEKEL